MHEQNQEFAGETLKAYYFSTKENWICIETNLGFYEVRSGGYLKLDSIDLNEYHRNPVDVNSEQVIQTVWGDDDTVYLELIGGKIIVIGFLSIDGTGMLYQDIYEMDHFSQLDNGYSNFNEIPGIYVLAGSNSSF